MSSTLENLLVTHHIKYSRQDVGCYASQSSPNLYKAVHSLSCISANHRATVGNTVLLQKAPRGATPGARSDPKHRQNWLHRNQATVSCDKRTVKLVSPSRKEVVTKLYLPKLEEEACDHLSVDDKEFNPIEAIRIVSEFPDVFPEELPGMPPERKVEFSIEYRVSGPELVELKKQIDELLEKGYIRLSPHLGQPQCYLWKRRMVRRGCALITEL
jgi:hypothetical protein